MKTKTKIAISIAVLVPFFSATAAWISGFNFDHRGNDIAVWYVTTVLISAFGFAATISYPD